MDILRDHIKHSSFVEYILLNFILIS